MAQSDIAHEGVVAAVEGRRVLVEVELGEACAGCSARKACSLGVATGSRAIEVTSAPEERFAVGERVVVAARRRVGALAVALSYVAPLAVLLAALLSAVALGAPEGVSAAVSLGAVALYYAVLWAVRDKISEKVNFTISKTGK